MGLIHFLVPRAERLSETALARAYVTGMDEVPWGGRFQRTEEGFVVERPVDESGCYHIPWSVDGSGEILLTTATLIERERPYLLEVELARGTLNSVRNRLAEWETYQVKMSEPLLGRLSECLETLSKVVVMQQDPIAACDLARDLLIKTLPLIAELGTAYASAVLAIRCQNGAKLTTLFGADLGNTLLDETTARGFLESFNTAVVPMDWHDVEKLEDKLDWSRTDAQVEWCHAHGMKVCSGPLIKFDRSGVPDWLYLWEGDEKSIGSYLEAHVQEKVTRYTGKVHVWQCASRMLTGDLLGLSSEQKMRMAIRILEIVRQIDARTPIVVTFDQPWGEYVSQSEGDLPLNFADALLRSNLGLAGIGLEINLDYRPGGTQMRHVLEFGRQLDRWSMLNQPLLLTLNVPGGSGSDALARRPDQPASEAWSAELQKTWIEQYVPLLLAKPAVQAVLWNQLRDDEPHDYAHAGLLDQQGTGKPSLAQLSAVRKAHLV